MGNELPSRLGNEAILYKRFRVMSESEYSSEICKGYHGMADGFVQADFGVYLLPFYGCRGIWI